MKVTRLEILALQKVLDAQRDYCWHSTGINLFKLIWNLKLLIRQIAIFLIIILGMDDQNFCISNEITLTFLSQPTCLSNWHCYIFYAEKYDVRIIKHFMVPTSTLRVW